MGILHEALTVHMSPIDEKLSHTAKRVRILNSLSEPEKNSHTWTDWHQLVFTFIFIVMKKKKT